MQKPLHQARSWPRSTRCGVMAAVTVVSLVLVGQPAVGHAQSEANPVAGLDIAVVPDDDPTALLPALPLAAAAEKLVKVTRFGVHVDGESQSNPASLVAAPGQFVQAQLVLEPQQQVLVRLGLQDVAVQAAARLEQQVAGTWAPVQLVAPEAVTADSQILLAKGQRLVVELLGEVPPGAGDVSLARLLPQVAPVGGEQVAVWPEAVQLTAQPARLVAGQGQSSAATVQFVPVDRATAALVVAADAADQGVPLAAGTYVLQHVDEWGRNLMAPQLVTMSSAGVPEFWTNAENNTSEQSAVRFVAGEKALAARLLQSQFFPEELFPAAELAQVASAVDAAATTAGVRELMQDAAAKLLAAQVQQGQGVLASPQGQWAAPQLRALLGRRLAAAQWQQQQLGSAETLLAAAAGVRQATRLLDGQQQGEWAQQVLQQLSLLSLEQQQSFQQRFAAAVGSRELHAQVAAAVQLQAAHQQLNTVRLVHHAAAWQAVPSLAQELTAAQQQLAAAQETESSAAAVAASEFAAAQRATAVQAVAANNPYGFYRSASFVDPTGGLPQQLRKQLVELVNQNYQLGGAAGVEVWAAGFSAGFLLTQALQQNLQDWFDEFKPQLQGELSANQLQDLQYTLSATAAGLAADSPAVSESLTAAETAARTPGYTRDQWLTLVQHVFDMTAPQDKSSFAIYLQQLINVRLKISGNMSAAKWQEWLRWQLDRSEFLTAAEKTQFEQQIAALAAAKQVDSFAAERLSSRIVESNFLRSPGFDLARFAQQGWYQQSTMAEQEAFLPVAQAILAGLVQDNRLLLPLAAQPAPYLTISSTLADVQKLLSERAKLSGLLTHPTVAENRLLTAAEKQEAAAALAQFVGRAVDNTQPYVELALALGELDRARQAWQLAEQAAAAAAQSRAALGLPGNDPQLAQFAAARTPQRAAWLEVLPPADQLTAAAVLAAARSQQQAADELVAATAALAGAEKLGVAPVQTAAQLTASTEQAAVLAQVPQAAFRFAGVAQQAALLQQLPGHDVAATTQAASGLDGEQRLAQLSVRLPELTGLNAWQREHAAEFLAAAPGLPELADRFDLLAQVSQLQDFVRSAVANGAQTAAVRGGTPELQQAFQQALAAVGDVEQFTDFPADLPQRLEPLLTAYEALVAHNEQGLQAALEQVSALEAQLSPADYQLLRSQILTAGDANTAADLAAAAAAAVKKQREEATAALNQLGNLPLNGGTEAQQQRYRELQEQAKAAVARGQEVPLPQLLLLLEQGNAAALTITGGATVWPPVVPEQTVQPVTQEPAVAAPAGTDQPGRQQVWATVLMIIGVLFALLGLGAAAVTLQDEVVDHG